jgi:Raf kinase inhibitor-like YbhB/YbcL family protein
MQLRSDSFRPYDFLDARFALGRPDGQKATFSENTNPHLAWDAVPEGTRSFAVLCWDPEVPSRGDDVNQEGRDVPIELPRVDFFHWVTCDLPASLREIPEGSHSSGVTERGKAPGATPHGGLQGSNDYKGWFAGSDLAGEWAGYDGPFQPWNDPRVHAYVFAVFALDVPSLGLSGSFSGHDVRKAMQGHILGEARRIGLYNLHRGARARIASIAASL